MEHFSLTDSTHERVDTANIAENIALTPTVHAASVLIALQWEVLSEHGQMRQVIFSIWGLREDRLDARSLNRRCAHPLQQPWHKAEASEIVFVSSKCHKGLA